MRYKTALSYSVLLDKIDLHHSILSSTLRHSFVYIIVPSQAREEATKVIIETFVGLIQAHHRFSLLFFSPVYYLLSLKTQIQ